jgi:hypothetical protein
VVWALAGFTSLVAGLLWGARLGVQFSLPGRAQGLPVLIIGGFRRLAALSRAAGRRRREAGGRLAGGVIGDGIETGSRICWRCCSCWRGRTACSASRPSSVSRNGPRGIHMDLTNTTSIPASRRLAWRQWVGPGMLALAAFVGVPLWATITGSMRFSCRF